MESKKTDAVRPRRFHTDTFEKASADRRDALLSVAIEQFAAKGFSATSVNEIARKAGISIGGLYSYFPTKDDLFLTVIERGRMLLEEALGDIDPDASFFDNFALLVRRARDYARANPELNRIYLDATTQGLRHLSSRLSGSLETITAELYRKALSSAIARGEIRADIDVGTAAFCLDNILVLFQFSFASDYFHDRLRIFLGVGLEDPLDEEALISSISDFARRALTEDASRFSG
jgi:TetR/AcrR family transcriptional regulator